MIHLLFISSVELNDVNDLLWTVLESIWTLSDSIRHSLPGLLERVNPLSSTLTDKARLGFVLMYRSGCPWPFRCVCVCVFIHLESFWMQPVIERRGQKWQNGVSHSWTHDIQLHGLVCTWDIWVNRRCMCVCLCMFAVFIPPWALRSESVNTMPPLISSAVLID